MELSKNTILITGGSSGIGLAFAKQLLKRGNEIIVTGRSREKLNAIKSQFPQIHFYECDLQKLEDLKLLCEKVKKEFPKLNVLINNAGIGLRLDLNTRLDDLALQTELATNLLAPIYMVNFLLPLLTRQPYSAIINVTSALAFMPLPTVPIYSATKAGLNSYTISLRQQLANTSVKVFEIAPPTTQTEMLNGFSPEDLKGVSVLPVDELVRICLDNLELDRLEICPGQAGKIKLLSRLAPSFLLKKMSKPVTSKLTNDRGI